MHEFDPNGVALNGNNIFGLPYHPEEAQLVIIPVPWEVTVSYRGGTSRGPSLVFESSNQVDLYDADGVDTWKRGYSMLPTDNAMMETSIATKLIAQAVMEMLGDGMQLESSETMQNMVREVDEACTSMINTTESISKKWLKKGKKLVLLGGDHSTPLGLMRALGNKYEDFGILQIDAHADLRIAYEGFKYSHASIMYNVLQEVSNMSKLVQVGIRDYCDEELAIIKAHPLRIATFFDAEIKRSMFEGNNWKEICAKIIDELPHNVYISFDIDGLDPKLCPNTGTPVPGGFETEQVYFLFNQIKAAGKKIIGFDLNEVSCGADESETIDAIVGARVLYKMCNIMMSE